MIFSRLRKREEAISLTVNNTQIEEVPHFKYMGIYLDSRLRWGKHVSETVAKVKKNIFSLNRAARSKWGIYLILDSNNFTLEQFDLFSCMDVSRGAMSTMSQD